MHKHLMYFNPDVMSLEQSHQDFSSKMGCFNAGEGYENFNDFITSEADEYKQAGDGVTYVVWNVLYDKNNVETEREIVAYYTLAATAIPYEDRIRRDEEEAKEIGEEFDIEICGISAIEIKMFAVSEKYQDVFFEYDGENLPVSAWIMRNIIDYAHSLLNNILGFKALFLHSLPEAETFYKANGFNPVEINMQPLHCVDSEYKSMYLTLKEVHMNYDD
ncbi:hypothetical protein [Eshraghiella crossota]|uniref:hypothetical protein n=1 Tax=Eshraghiella crossota TaxID=45851 RepID=UPI004027F2E5